jgi:hypothetical protein
MLRMVFVFSHIYTVCFIMFSVITNIYSKKTKGPTLLELFAATGELFQVPVAMNNSNRVGPLVFLL